LLCPQHKGGIIAEKLRGFVKRGAHVLDAKVGNALERNAVVGSIIFARCAIEPEH